MHGPNDFQYTFTRWQQDHLTPSAKRRPTTLPAPDAERHKEAYREELAKRSTK